MPTKDENDDLDQLIDVAVDTFFVEAPTTGEYTLPTDSVIPASPPSPPTGAPSGPSQESPSFEEAVDTLFITAFKGSPQSVTSGDQETDWAIDLAVDTLFVEQPEAPPPETAQVEARVAESGNEAEQFGEYDEIPAPAPPRKDLSNRTGSAVPAPKGRAASPVAVSYEDVVAEEISRHMHTLYDDTVYADQVPAARHAGESALETDVRPRESPVRAADSFPLRKLQETILTLEWEISKRSVSALAGELQKVRTRFQDNVTVDFAALAMKVVLEYIVKRMSRAHPESVRFLMEVTDYLDRKLSSSEDDPLVAFHQILTRYEKYKSTVRSAEGIVDRTPPILRQLEIRDADAFSRLVERQATAIARAGRSLARRLDRSGNPENVIRSFRFLVSRSVNRILESTLKEDARKLSDTKTRPKRRSR